MAGASHFRFQKGLCGLFCTGIYPSCRTLEEKHTKGKRCKSSALSISSHPSPSSDVLLWCSILQPLPPGSGQTLAEIMAVKWLRHHAPAKLQNFFQRATRVLSAAWQHKGAGRKVWAQILNAPGHSSSQRREFLWGQFALQRWIEVLAQILTLWKIAQGKLHLIKNYWEIM